MKAIKIASGVAITALALAISAQANAAAHEGGSTETEWSFTGSMEAVYLIDLKGTDSNGDEATVMDVDLDEEDDFDSGVAGDGWGLEANMSIVHGPFSSGLIFTADGTNTVAVEADDIVITDGAISFGQVGSVITTHEYTYDMDDSTALGDVDEGAPVDAAIRYTMDDLKVQVEGQNDSTTPATDYGIGVAYEGSADAISYVADANVRVSDQSPDDADAYTYVGAGVTYTADMFTASAAFNTYNAPTTAAQVASGEKEAFSEYGFELTTTPVENLSAYLKGQDLDAGNDTDSMQLLAGVSYTAGMITVTGEYLYTAAESTGDEIFGEVVYTDGPLSAYGDVTLGNIDADTADDAQIGAGVSYTKDNGVKYAADYDMQGDTQSEFKLSAAYAF